MKVKVQGVDELVIKLRNLKGMSDEITSDALLAGALVLEGEVKLSMQQTQRGGRIYTRGAKTHQASTPGQPPAIDYGYLFNSIKAEKDGKDAIVYTNAEYAAALEFGTAKMQARPFMRRAVKAHEVKIIAAVRTTAKRLIER